MPEGAINAELKVTQLFQNSIQPMIFKIILKPFPEIKRKKERNREKRNKGERKEKWIH